MLNKYGAYTYHITIHQIKQEFIGSFNSVNDPGKYLNFKNLIVGTGVTAEYGLTSMNQAFVMDSSKLGNTLAHRFNVSLNEPNGGATLMEKLISAASSNYDYIGKNQDEDKNRAPHMNCL